MSSGRDILRGIAKYARQVGLWHLRHVPQGLDEDLPEWLESWAGDGIIARVKSAEQLERLLQYDLPIVDVLGLVEGSLLPVVHVDDRDIAIRVAQHFQHRGFRHLAFYGLERESWSRKRQAGFREACKDADSYHEMTTLLPATHEGPETAMRLRQWIDALPKPVGIMVSTDRCGPPVLETCRELGLLVPEEVAVVGVDNDRPLCECSMPPLSSVQADHHSVGYEAARLLNGLLDGRPPPSAPRFTQAEGIAVRESSETIAIPDPAVARGVNFIRRNLAAPITTDDVARAAGVCRTSLQRRFSQTMGKPIRDYIIAERLKRARSLITETDFLLSDIATRCGFRHQEYLGSVFRKHFGMSPGTLRKNNREQSGGEQDVVR